MRVASFDNPTPPDLRTMPEAVAKSISEIGERRAQRLATKPSATNLRRYVAVRDVGSSPIAVPDSPGRNVTLQFFASGPLEHADEWADAQLVVPVDEALDMLAFLGLAREVFGTCNAPDLAARIRRALWPSRRAPVAMVPHLVELLDVAERAHGGLVAYL